MDNRWAAAKDSGSIHVTIVERPYVGFIRMANS